MIARKTLKVCLTQCININVVCMSTFILILCVGDSMLLISNGISTAICTDRLSLKLWRREGGGGRVEEREWRREGGGWRREGGGGKQSRKESEEMKTKRCGGMEEDEIS